MTDAPERIWAKPNYDEWRIGGWDTHGKAGGTEYTRADLIPAMLAKAQQRGRDEVMREMPDEIELYRIMRRANGRKRIDFAKAIATAIRARANGEGGE